MNRTKGKRFTSNRQNRPEYAFFWEIFGGKSYTAADIAVEEVLRVTSAMGIPFSEGAFFSKLKFLVFCYS